MDNIYLVGLMGCGKTSLGKLLAKKIHRRHVDTDILVEEKMKMSVMEIFHTYGEERFRQEETETLRILSKQRNRVVSCGGGIVLKEENIKLMQNSGKVLWIKRDPVLILQGKRIHKRPLLAKNPDKIYEIWEKREPLYRMASQAVVENNGDKNETLHRIMKAIWG